MMHAAHWCTHRASHLASSHACHGPGHSYIHGWLPTVLLIFVIFRVGSLSWHPEIYSVLILSCFRLVFLAVPMTH
jgi:hypothetical protein